MSRVRVPADAKVRDAAFVLERVGSQSSAEGRKALAELARAVPQTGTRPLRRAPSLHLDGTPIQLSVAVAHTTTTLRVAVEPGELGDGLDSQVVVGQHVLDDLVALLGWRDGCADALRAVLDTVLAPSEDGYEGWWGALWVGLALGPALAVRAYGNLRTGDLPSRWTRLAAVFARLGRGARPHAAIQMARLAADVATPVGIGLDIAGGRATSLKTYFGVAQPSVDALIALAPADARSVTQSALAATGLGELLAEAPPQSVTVAYDVHLDEDGLPARAVARYKFDLDVTTLATDDVAARAHAVRAAMSVQPRGRAAVDNCWALAGEPDGGRRAQYVGASVTAGGLATVNVYLRPGGLSDPRLA